MTESTVTLQGKEGWNGRERAPKRGAQRGEEWMPAPNASAHLSIYLSIYRTKKKPRKGVKKEPPAASRFARAWRATRAAEPTTP